MYHNSIIYSRSQNQNITTTAKKLRNLPEWDLSDLYPSDDCAEIKADTAWVQSACTDFNNHYKEKLSTLNARELLAAIQKYEKIQIVCGRIMSFFSLRYYQNTASQKRGKQLSDMQTKITDFLANLVFFTLEINRLDDKKIDNLLLSDSALNRYQPIFEQIRAMKPHTLSDELEQFLHDQSVVGSTAWNRLFDETIAALRFNVNNKSLNLETTLNLLSDHDRDKRQTVSKSLTKVFSQNITLFSRISNTLIKEKQIKDQWRSLPTPQAGRHLQNQIEVEVIDALRNAVVNAYPKISHRYYALKAKWLKLEKLQTWDRNAPLPDEDKRIINWNEARKIIIQAYGDFSPKMAQIAQVFFDKGWIDAGVKDGKSAGAFAHPTVVDVHPYILLNYLGKPRDVMTLAHELGHGVHQILAADQGQLLSQTPLTLAETASVFGEMLTFQKLLEQANNNKTRKHLLASKVEDMINTVVRQIAFYDFECKLHAKRAEGELTSGQINDLWMSVQSESLGPVFEFQPGYETFWCYVPHFIHSPFYVYAYAFGDGLVNALYAVYIQGDTDFTEKYFNMLAAGGSKHHKELLAPFGLDAADPNFWNQGLNLISTMIDQLETM